MTEISSNNANIGTNAKKFILTPWSITFLAPLFVAIFDTANLPTVLSIAITAFLQTLPYILVAILLIAYLKAVGAESMVANIFKGREYRMIFTAAIFGGLAPFCSCEVIPFIAGLLALGAPLSAVMAFWLSSPLIDPASLLITAGALGWSFAIAKTLAAIGLGIFRGFLVKMIIKHHAFANPLRQSTQQMCGCGPDPFDGKPVWQFWLEKNRRGVFRHEFIQNGLFLIKWLALAYVFEALLITYVPASLIVGLVGGEGVTPIIISAFVGMPAYLNSFIAPPLVAGLVEQGMSVGAALSFMVAGAVSSIPAMTAVWSLVKPQVFALYIGLGISGAIISGVLFQLVI